MLRALTDIAQDILQATAWIARIVDKRVLLLDALKSWSWCAGLDVGHHGTYLHKAETCGCQLIEVVAIGVEACGNAYGIAEMYAKNLALKLLTAGCKGCAQPPLARK